MKCRHCKTKFIQRTFLQKYCCETDECSKAFSEYAKKAMQKNWKKEKQVMKIDVYVKENKTDLQKEVNKLARMIDAKFEYVCIDCGKELNKEKHQIDACHLISRKKNSTLRYNLHNLHSGHNHCNTMNESHETNYKIGLEQRYGKEYATMVIDELKVKYKEIHLSNVEVSEKLKLVRAIVRNFDTYSFTDSVNARNVLNNLIGIYN